MAQTLRIEKLLIGGGRARDRSVASVDVLKQITETGVKILSDASL
jgi:hypothetical protein